MSRLVVLDTETTGLDPAAGHRVIEFGGVEVVDRRLTGRNLHLYLQPDREVDPAAIEVHGIRDADLVGKPRFADVREEILDYIDGAELVIHNAAFDVGFLEHEFRLAGHPVVLGERCHVTDTLAMARRRYPGQRNSLDALCKRLDIDNARRVLHGALLDAEILADVYLAMTGGQATLQLAMHSREAPDGDDARPRFDASALPVIRASREELARHESWLDAADGRGGSVWRRLDG